MQLGLSLRVTGVVVLDTFGQQPFASPLATTCECGASAFRLHAGAKTVLVFACALGRLVGAFHFFVGAEAGAKLKIRGALST
jgi:hypothetical protein